MEQKTFLDYSLLCSFIQTLELLIPLPDEISELKKTLAKRIKRENLLPTNQPLPEWLINSRRNLPERVIEDYNNVAKMVMEAANQYYFQTLSRCALN